MKRLEIRERFRLRTAIGPFDGEPVLFRGLVVPRDQTNNLGASFKKPNHRPVLSSRWKWTSDVCSKVTILRLQACRCKDRTPAAPPAGRSSSMISSVSLPEFRPRGANMIQFGLHLRDPRELQLQRA
jgi:hypothetical protein